MTQSGREKRAYWGERGEGSDGEKNGVNTERRNTKAEKQRGREWNRDSGGVKDK